MRYEISHFNTKNIDAGLIHTTYSVKIFLGKFFDDV